MESRMINTVVDGKATLVKVCVDWQRVAKNLAKKAQSSKGGRAIECSGAVRVEAVPVGDARCNCSFIDAEHSHDCPCHPDHKRIFKG